jgi:glycosyltransferase involved in cell wall biosynthesis
VGVSTSSASTKFRQRKSQALGEGRSATHLKFSIVTISFNQAEFLERTILSVIAQKDVDMEYIIVDPGSTDGSRDIIERYRGTFSHVIFEPDAGPADGLNKGFAVASGDWFGYINSDDFYLPGGLAAVDVATRRFPQAGAIVGNGHIVDESDNFLRKSRRRLAWGLLLAAAGDLLRSWRFSRCGRIQHRQWNLLGQRNPSGDGQAKLPGRAFLCRCRRLSNSLAIDHR